jgi:hypothetical protein
MSNLHDVWPRDRCRPGLLGDERSGHYGAQRSGLDPTSRVDACSQNPNQRLGPRHPREPRMSEVNGDSRG